MNKEKGVKEAAPLPINKDWTLDNLNLSGKKPKMDWTLLKNTINKIIFLGIQLNRPKHEIETLIKAGDLIDNIMDEIELRNYFHPHENILNKQNTVPGV